MFISLVLDISLAFVISNAVVVSCFFVTGLVLLACFFLLSFVLVIGLIQREILKPASLF